ncbi:MAG: DUF4070 domain-containing protein [Puniceicoccaceae bacterium]|nr:MAG: DUF4070 domain-containing protein [Puniceicoccaceae bacterium]
MNALLINPEFPATYWSFKFALRFLGKRAAFPPLGLLTIAAMLPREWNLRLVDMNVRCLRRSDLAWADLVLIGGMVVQKTSARKAIAQAKAAGLPVVAGGPLFTCEPESFPEVDHLVLNEAEITLPRFLADWEAGRPRRLYSAINYPTLEDTPVPRWDLINPADYASMSLQVSRGCPFDCEFCNVTALLGHRPRVKSTTQVLAELDALRATGWRGSVFFVDDNFIGNKRFLLQELLPALEAWQRQGHRNPLYTEASINLADDPRLMAAMVRAGFDTVFVGIETPSTEGLTECNKRQNINRNLLESVRTLQRAGLQVQGGFIVGFDSDGPDIFERQIEFIQQSGIVMAMVGILQAPVGTRLFERLSRENRIRGLSGGDNADSSTNIIPRMSLESLHRGYRRIYEGIYFPKPYYERVRRFLREYRTPEIRQRLQWAHLRAFLGSTIRLGIVGRERIHFWKLLSWTLIRRRQLFPTAVTLAILGHHFRKVYQSQAGSPQPGEP